MSNPTQIFQLFFRFRGANLESLLIFSNFANVKKIGYDGKRAVSNMTGLGNYSRLVLESVGRRFPDRTLLVYTPAMKANGRLAALHELDNVQFHVPDRKGPMNSGALWRSFRLTEQLRRDGVELFHGLSNELPFTIEKADIPSVVTMHDVIYRRLPYCYSPIDRLLYDIKYGESCRMATRIIAVSERTKEDVCELYDITPEKVDVVYQGCDESFRQVLSTVHLEEIRKRYELPARYILQVGTIERRKNLELTIRAMTTLPADVHLVAVGRGGRYKEKMEKLAERLGVRERVHFKSGIPFVDLPAINQRADVIVYPSHYEGFGIPVLEGIESRRPVVAATGSCLEEAGGEAAWYVDPNDARALGNLLVGLTDGSIDTAPRIVAGKKYARRFDNSTMAENLESVYEKALSDYRSKHL